MAAYKLHTSVLTQLDRQQHFFFSFLFYYFNLLPCLIQTRKGCDYAICWIKIPIWMDRPINDAVGNTPVYVLVCYLIEPNIICSLSPPSLIDYHP